MQIEKYLKHTVDVVHITETYKGRTEVIDYNVPAFITQKSVIIMDTTGNHLEDRTLVFLKGNANISDSDEIKLDGKQRPIDKVKLMRNDKSSVIQHVEVTLK